MGFAASVVQVDDQGGREERFYGKLGEVVKEIKTIASDTQGNSANSPDPFKPVEGRRPVRIPEGVEVGRGKTPGGEGPYNGRGGANETLIPGGLPPGSVGPWEPLP